MVTFWQLTSCIRRRSGMVCFAVPNVDIDLMRRNLVRVSRSLVLLKMLQPRREYERFQKTPICLWRHFRRT